MLTSLDLFTGIGGFSHALSNVCKPIAYCDVHDLSKRALHDLMDRGLLPHAPIFHDVKEITPQTLEATCGVKTFDVLCAGFPCQDVSVMNIRGKGIDGERSGLIHEVLRIARACQPSLLFLENSPNLIHRGLDRIQADLKKIGYSDFRWDIFSAEDVGAPHVRRRFYMVAVHRNPKSNAVLRKCLSLLLSLLEHHHKRQKQKDNNSPSFWSTHRPPVRVIPKSPQKVEELNARGFLLGNAVVPPCTLHACMSLCRSLILPSSRIPLHLPHKKLTCELEMLVPKTKRIGEDPVVEYRKKHWATPLSCNWYASRVGSDRAMQHLPNQILYEKRTREYMKKKGKPNTDDWIVNPEFIEWLMGFPRGWTKYSARKRL